MNKTLLLIICDFLLLNLLALTRWEQAEPTHPLRTAAPGAAAAAPAQNQDMVELMKISLQDEQAARQQVVQKLQTVQSDLQGRQQNVTQLQAQKAQLESTLQETARNAGDLAAK